MRRIAKLIAALALSAALCLGCAALAFASQPSGGNSGGEGGPAVQMPTVTYADRAVTVSPGSKYHETDLFDGFKDVMPGDVIDQPIAISNRGGVSVDVYLKAAPHDEQGNPLEYSEPFEDEDGKDQGQDANKGDLVGGPGQRDETVATMRDFLAQLTLQVYDGRKLLYEAKPGEAPPEGADEGTVSLLALGDGDDMSAAVHLGTVPAGGSKEITARLIVPVELGNEYANRVGEVDWVFIVAEHDPYVPPTEDPDDPLPPIEPDEPLPDTGDDPKPEGPLGQTGDTAPLALLSAVAVLAAVLVVIAAVMRRFSRR